MTRGRRCPDFVAILRETEPDEALHEQVARCFAGELAWQARRQCRDGTLAEDAAQEALLTALQALGTFRGDAPLERWLHRLVVSSCSRLRRGRKNDPTFNLPIDDVSEAHAAGHTGAAQETTAIARERLGMLSNALGEIDEDNREIFLLHEGQDIPLHELAERFETTVDAIKGRLRRTRALLRRRLIEMAAPDE